MNRWLFFICLLFLLPVVTLAQGNGFPREVSNGLEDSSRKAMRKRRPDFLVVGTGLSRSWFRDFATSPLIYKGTPLRLSLGHSRQDHFREVRLGLDYSTGRYLAIFNRNGAASSVNSFFFRYERLNRLSLFPSSKWNLKAGGVAQLTGNIRDNASLLNNSFGMEFMGNIAASAKVTRYLVRSQPKSGKFLFIPYSLKPRERILSFQFDLGLLNSTFRNGFIYNNQSAILNQENFIAGYEFNFLSGFRIGTQLNYTIFSQRGNAVQISYLWDAYQTGGDYERFQMAHHFLRLSLMFRTQ